MKELKLNSCKELAKIMLDDANEGQVVVAALFFENASELVKEIIRQADSIEIDGIEMASVDYSGYYKEYYVTVDKFEKTGLLLDVEPAWHEENEYHKACYYDFEADKLFIESDACSKITKNVPGYNCYEVIISEDQGENKTVKEQNSSGKIEIQDNSKQAVKKEETKKPTEKKDTNTDEKLAKGIKDIKNIEDTFYEDLEKSLCKVLESILDVLTD